MAATDPTAAEPSRFLVCPARLLWLGAATIGLIVLLLAFRADFRSASVSRNLSGKKSGVGGGSDSIDKNAFLIGLSESERTDLGKVAFDQQPEVQQVFSAIWALESEVNNGGFQQYFFNCDSDIIAYAPTALSAIGAKSCAEIVEQAIQLMAPLPETQGGRYAALEALDEDAQARLSALDSEFWSYPDNLTELLFAFVSRYPGTFGPLP